MFEEAGQPMANTFDVEQDRHLVKRARKGNESAMETIYMTFKDPVFRLARRVCGEADGAEEVVQETFMEVVRSIGRYRGEAPLGAWIKKIAASKSLMRLRRAKSRPSSQPLLEERHADAATHLEPGVSVDIEKLLNRLPSETRAVLWLHDVEGYTHAEIGELMGKSKSFSKSRLSRAYAELRNKFSPALEGGNHASIP